MTNIRARLFSLKPKVLSAGKSLLKLTLAGIKNGKIGVLEGVLEIPCQSDKILLRAGHFRKLTTTKGTFPNENSFIKLLYMGNQNTSKKWAMTV